jgi:hypothetical protein
MAYGQARFGAGLPIWQAISHFFTMAFLLVGYLNALP